MGKNDYFKLGDHNAICAVCGFQRKAGDMKLRWDGVWVCRQDWEPRQPQDFVRAQPEETAPLWTQPEPPPIYLNSTNLLGNIVVGTPSIYVNGVLQTPGVAYTISLPDGALTFSSAPASGATLAWSGVWKDNAGVSTTYTQFPFASGTGFTTLFQLYGVN